MDFFNLIYWVIQQKSEAEKNKDDNHLYERRFQNQLTHTRYGETCDLHTIGNLEATILNFWSSFHKLGVYEGIENLWKLSNGQTETF